MNVETLKEKNFFSLAIYAARPKTLVAALLPVVLGMFIAKGEGSYNIVTYLYTLMCAIFIQVGTNYANDYFDAVTGKDTSERLGPPRVGSLNLVSKQALMTLAILAFGCATLCAIPLAKAAGIYILYLMALAVFLGFAYSWGKYSLANTGLANSVVFAVFGPLATVMSYYIQTGHLSAKAAFIGLIPGSLSIMMFAMNNLRDIEQDRKAGKKTLAVRFGFNWGKKEFQRALFLSWATLPLAMILFNTPAITLLPLALFPQGVKIGKAVNDAETGKDIVPLFERVAKYNALYALLCAIAWRIACS